MDEIRLLRDLEHPPGVAEPAAGSSGPSPRPEAAHAAAPEPRPSASSPGSPPPRSTVRDRERRVATRYRAVDGRCWLGWHDAVRFRQSAGWIINISASGCLVASDEAPPADRSVWLRLDKPELPEWAEARVVHLQESQSGIHAVRLVFRGSCPYAIIKAVAFSSAGKPAERPERFASWDLNTW
jgi:hypothetical protein